MYCINVYMSDLDQFYEHDWIEASCLLVCLWNARHCLQLKKKATTKYIYIWVYWAILSIAARDVVRKIRWKQKFAIKMLQKLNVLKKLHSHSLTRSGNMMNGLKLYTFSYSGNKLSMDKTDTQINKQTYRRLGDIHGPNRIYES